MADAVKVGVGADGSPDRAAELKLVLQAAIGMAFDGASLIDAEEAAELKTARKNEAQTRRILAPSISTFPWLQCLAGAERKGKVDPYQLGRQLSVALRVYSPDSISALQSMTRRDRADRFKAAHVSFLGPGYLGGIAVFSSADWCVGAATRSSV